VAGNADVMDKVVNLCKRRGFVFPSSEIYGGFESCWDYGPLGVELKRNIKEAWWHAMVRSRSNIVGIESSILMHPQVWRTTGHVDNFVDTLVECTACRRRFRADHVEGNQCPACGGSFSPPRKFNTMFRTFVGPVEDESAVAYLRPETAQGMFVNFKNVQAAARQKLPFGIAQIGKSFRNEITPGNFIFRTREFEQMEMEFFCAPDTDEYWHRYWMEARKAWYIAYGIRPENLRLRQHEADELAFYAKSAWDVEYQFPFGWGELEGIANRTDYDLRRHSQESGVELTYFDEEKKQHVFPYVIEPAAGADRCLLTFLLDAYAEEPDEKGDLRVVLHLHPYLAPIKVGVFPLVKKDRLPEISRAITERLQRHWLVFYDESGAIGRRYRRQDEIGTPFCVTVDFQTLEDDTVTVRHRDTMKQDRVAIADLVAYFQERIHFEANPEIVVSERE
jgi:glycyl-tRNA synthetase